MQFNLPESISRPRFLEALRMLDLDPSEISEFRFEPHVLIVTVLAKNPDGRRYAHDDRVAVHMITIPIVEVEE